MYPQASRLRKLLPDSTPCKAGAQLINTKLPVQHSSPDSEDMALPCHGFNATFNNSDGVTPAKGEER